MQPQHSIEALEIALEAIQEGKSHPLSAGVLQNAITELAALRAWRDAAVPLLRALVADAMRYGDDWPWCQYCIHSESEGHAADCPVTRAKTLLAESEGRDGR